MAELKYNGDIINSSVSSLISISNEFNSLSTSIKQATNRIVSARGFNEYVGGISSDSFSNGVMQCNFAATTLVQMIRQTQIQILSYSQDDNEIQAFLNSLDNVDYKNLDLSGIEDHIGIYRKAGNFFSGIGASVFTFGASLLEGIMDFGETGADLIVLGGTAISSIFTSGYDYFNGTNITEQIWKDTKAYVSEKKVESMFNSFYDNTEFGQMIKRNAYGFDSVRGVGKGLGYTAGVIGLTALTGGIGSTGAIGTIGSGQLALTAGLFGFSNGTEEAWADGASISKGLEYGAASGGWEAAQWAIGGKINQFGNVGGQVAGNLFKNSAIRVGLDSVDAAAEGFVQPALKMIYKDYEGDTFLEKYKNAFQENGGWGTVGTQALVGGIMSAGSEYMNARRLLKNSSDISKVDFSELSLEQQRFNATHTIDGNEIKSASTIFNSNMSDLSGISGRDFNDGAFIPTVSLDRIKDIDPRYSASAMQKLLMENKDYMSASDFNSLWKESEIFKSNNLDVSVNELKLIASHSNGNVGRIKQSLSYFHKGTDFDVDGVAKTLSKDIFFTDVSSEVLKRRSVINEYIDECSKDRGSISWKSNDELIRDFNSRQFNKFDFSGHQSKISRYFDGNISDDIVREIALTDGYAESIKEVLKKSGNIPSESLDKISNDLAVKIFMPTHMDNMQKISMVNSGNTRAMFSFTGDYYDSIRSCTDIFRASDEFLSTRDTRHLYNKAYDYLIKESGYSEKEAAEFVWDAYTKALDARGYDTFVRNINGQDITIHRIKGFRESSGTFASVDNVVSTIEKMPEQFQALTKQYVIYDSYSSGDKLSGIRYKDDNFVSSMTNHGGGDYISIWNHGETFKDIESIHHEIGHSIDSIESYNAVSDSQEWKTAMKSDEILSGKKAVTEYGGTFDSEDFAEAIMYYFNDYDNFIKTFPNRTKVIESLIEKYAKK